MSTSSESQSPRERSVIYAVVVGVLIVLGVIATLLFLDRRQEARDLEKAEQLLSAFSDAGISVTLSAEQIAEVLGDDGGATCADPNAALSRATLLAGLANGAGGPGTRPVIVESRLLQGQLLIIETYCPEQAEGFRQFVDSLTTVRARTDG